MGGDDEEVRALFPDGGVCEGWTGAGLWVGEEEVGGGWGGGGSGGGGGRVG